MPEFHRIPGVSKPILYFFLACDFVMFSFRAMTIVKKNRKQPKDRELFFALLTLTFWAATMGTARRKPPRHSKSIAEFKVQKFFDTLNGSSRRNMELFCREKYKCFIIIASTACVRDSKSYTMFGVARALHQRELTPSNKPRFTAQNTYLEYPHKCAQLYVISKLGRETHRRKTVAEN